MSKCISRSSGHDAQRWLELETTSSSRELVSIERLLSEAGSAVAEPARAKSLAIVLVPVDDEVFVNRAMVIFVVTALLRTAIDATPVGSRIALTAQEMERELVFAVYDSASGVVRATQFDPLVERAALVLHGRVWRSVSPEGNLALFSLPLDIEQN